jgi:phage tail-like protein
VRGLIVGLESPYPLALGLPPLYLDGDDARNGEAPFAVRLTRALDGVLAPVVSSLDNIDAYLDPGLAPDDFVEWLARWVGLSLDETWPIERCRELVGQTVALYGARGTRTGLAEEVRILTGVEPDIVEGGSVTWSTTPDSPLGEDPEPRVVVRLATPEGADLDLEEVRARVAASVPANLAVDVEAVAA